MLTHNFVNSCSDFTITNKNCISHGFTKNIHLQGIKPRHSVIYWHDKYWVTPKWLDPCRGLYTF